MPAGLATPGGKGEPLLPGWLLQEAAALLLTGCGQGRMETQAPGWSRSDLTALTGCVDLRLLPSAHVYPHRLTRDDLLYYSLSVLNKIQSAWHSA